MQNKTPKVQTRRDALLRRLQSRQPISTTDLAREFGVNPMTIRRDLQALGDKGLALRCYGGALPAQRIAFEFAFDEKRRHNLAAKSRIGQTAAQIVQPGQTVFLDTGTTTLEVARSLASRQVPCRVITSSLVIASELWTCPSVQLVLLGGQVRSGSPDLAGAATQSMLERFSADIAFLGSDGIDPDRGVFAADPDIAKAAEMMGRQSRRVVVVADSSKLGHAASDRLLTFDQIHDLVTDKNACAQVLRRIRKKGIRIALVAAR